MNWYLAVLKNYVGFSGRARRKEYWMFTLVNTVVLVALMILDSVLNSQIPESVYLLATVLPALAVAVRRLHDTGRSGWWLLIGLIPLVGSVTLLVFACQDSQGVENSHGANPKAVPVAA